VELAQRLRAKEISPVEATKAQLARIAELDPTLKSYATVTPDAALAEARQAEGEIARGLWRGPLHGVPIAVKDLCYTKGIPTAAGMPIHRNFKPDFDATVVARLKAAGAVILGKLQLTEGAFADHHPTIAPPVNPWNAEHWSGASSSGSGVATAAGLCYASLGSDTGGSIRQPAALCGVVGLKPTYGRVSRYGLLAFASSLDQIGPFTKDVTDCALLLRAIAGHDPRDSTSAPVDVPDYLGALRGDLRGVRLGVPREYFVQGMQAGMEEIVRGAMEALRAQGAELVDVSLPSTRYALATYYIIAPAEASANLARYDGIKYGYSAGAPRMWENYDLTRGAGFGAEVKRRIMLGTYALSEGYADQYYRQAQKVRTLIKTEFDEVFRTCDALVAPVSPVVAFRLGQRLDDPYQMYLCDVCTLPANIAGIPGISVPCGLLEDLPVGLQVLAPAFGEPVALRVAYAYEQSGHFKPGKPPL
jgi:aspartyl-tRNA(Asn)/glutamyl-tRNA(Gln) amidotransferase subunit A